MFSFIKNKLAYQLTLYVVLFSLLVTLLVTGVQLVLDYRHEVSDIHHFLDSIEKTHMRSIEESVWALDDIQVNLQLEGLINRDDITYAAVLMDEVIIWSRGVIVPTRVVEVRHPIYHLSRKTRSCIGTFHIVASLEGVYKRLLRHFIIILFSNAIKTFLIAGFILLLFQRHLTRHLSVLAGFVQQWDIQKPSLPLTLDRELRTHHMDELDQVASVINSMQEKGYQAYETLKSQEEQLRMFFDSTEEGILALDEQGTCTFMNQACSRFFADTDKECTVGKNILRFLTTDCGNSRNGVQHGQFAEQILKTLRDGTVESCEGLQLFGVNGIPRVVALRSYPVFERELCSGALLFLKDISDQQRLEQEKQLLAKVIRYSPVVIIITSGAGRVQYVNPGFEQLMGLAADEVIGQKPGFLRKDLRVPGQFRKVMNSIGRGKQWRGRLTNRDCRGKIFTLDAAVSPVYGPDGMLANVVCVANDITRELGLQDQLYHAQKMEAIQQLAGSISHEFGNPLLGVRFVLRDLQKRTSLPPEDRELLALAEKECDRMRGLIRHLQRFDRPTSGLKKCFDLHEMLDDLFTFHRTFFASRKIQITKRYIASKMKINAVEDQLRQVVINLMLNAADAMKKDGDMITVTTAMEQERVVISVGDNGIGIPPEAMDHIFEPFFTTKPEVEGTGLGLPVSYAIIRAHGGRITVNSVPGKTVFRISLPCGDVNGTEGV